MNQGRHPGREATRRSTQQAKAKHPALVHFIHKRILPRLRTKLLARMQANREPASEVQDVHLTATPEGGAA